LPVRSPTDGPLEEAQRGKKCCTLDRYYRDYEVRREGKGASNHSQGEFPPSGKILKPVDLEKKGKVTPRARRTKDGRGGKGVVINSPTPRYAVS